MSEAPTIQASETATCRSCRAPLAPDQRYCLSCGARVADPRLPFLDVLAGAPAAGAGAPLQAAPGASSRPGLARQLDRIGGPMGAAAVLLVALGVGFLLGSSGRGASTVIQRPPVVNVQSGAPAAGTTTSGASGAGGGASTTGNGKKGKGSSGGAGTKGVPTAPAKDTSGGNVNKLKQQPLDQATPGAPPPKDNKQAGGGSPTESIG
jgi:hypothetical protein